MKNWFKTNTDSSPKDKKWWKPNISWLKLDKWVKRLDIYIIKKFLGTYFFAIHHLNISTSHHLTITP